MAYFKKYPEKNTLHLQCKEPEFTTFKSQCTQLMVNSVYFVTGQQHFQWHISTQKKYRIPFLYIKQTKGKGNNFLNQQQTTDSLIGNLFGRKLKHLALFPFKYTSMNDLYPF